MEICSLVSGERLAVLDDVEGTSARAVKQSLALQLGLPRFRQRVLVEDGSQEIADEEVFATAPGKVLLVLYWDLRKLMGKQTH